MKHNYCERRSSRVMKAPIDGPAVAAAAVGAAAAGVGAAAAAGAESSPSTV